MSKRNDAVECKDIGAVNKTFPYIMIHRADAEVSMKQEYDITELLKYCENKKKNGYEFKPFHAVVYAMAKTIYLRPKMNRFISGRKYWQRNDIIMSFVAKQKFEDGAKESLVFLRVKPEMNADDISHIILGDVKRIKSGNSDDFEKLIKKAMSMPRFIKVFFFRILYILEYFGKMPKAFTEGDTNYSTVLLSNLGSIGVDSCYHHLNNYGTNSIMMTVGKYYEKEGRVYLPMTIIIDERIADGFYYAKSLRIAKFLLEHPQYLDGRIDAPIPFDAETGKIIDNAGNDSCHETKTTKRKRTKALKAKEA